MIKKRCIYLSLGLIISIAAWDIGTAQNQNDKFLGVKVGTSTYTSYWFYSTGSLATGARRPIHDLQRFHVGIFYEKNHLFSLKPLRTDLILEADLGVTGETREDFRSGQVVSTGGLSLSLAGLVNFGYPITPQGSASDLSIVPGIALGPQVAVINNNGQGSESDDLGYPEGWLETVYGLAANISVAFQFKNLIVVPEYRLFIVASGTTDWEPDGREPGTDGVDLSAFALKVGFKIN